MSKRPLRQFSADCGEILCEKLHAIHMVNANFVKIDTPKAAIQYRCKIIFFAAFFIFDFRILQNLEQKIIYQKYLIYCELIGALNTVLGLVAKKTAYIYILHIYEGRTESHEQQFFVK